MIGYLDLPSGLSGDMMLGCLVNAGWPIERLSHMLSTLGLAKLGCRVSAQSVMKGPLCAMKVDVQVLPQQVHRKLGDIRQIIEQADLSESVKQRAVGVFVRLAEAEANVHGTTIEEIHFHEVGGLDAIVDIVGSVLGLAELNIETLYSSPPTIGEGWTESMHGPIPLPAPATLELLAAVSAPIRPASANATGEFLTPTGAALLAELAIFEQPAMRLRRIATGAGSRETKKPNIARLWLGEHMECGPMIQIETNIDDMNPQHYAVVSDRLFAAGARDVWLTPVQMKKGRPAVVLSVLAAQEHEQVLVNLVLRETTTMGVRIVPVRRHEARRVESCVDTRYGTVRVKQKWIGDELVGAYPEYDDCVVLADKHAVTLRMIYESAIVAAHEKMQNSQIT